MQESVLTTRNLCKQYGSFMAVDHVNLQVERGQIYGLVGKNGAGKTTLMRLITSQSIPTSGEIELFGGSSKEGLREGRGRLGAVVETPSFYPFLTARENLEYYRIQRGIPGKHCVDEMLELVELENTGKKKFKNLSLGMKQRLGLALAMLSHPELLILDEPVNGLDPMGIVHFRRVLLRLNEEERITILISSHILSELSNLATHYGFIDEGRLLQQTTAKEIQQACRECIEIVVDDTAKAAAVLENELQCRDFEVLPENHMKIYAFLGEPAKLTQALIRNDVNIFEINSRGANLEDYYLSLLKQF